MKQRLLSLLALLGVHGGTLSAEQKHDAAIAAAQATPGAALATGAHAVEWWGSELLGWASFAFIVLQCAYLVWKWRRDVRREQDRQDDRLAGRPCNYDTGNADL